jgi:glycosyltransferase involved in cell wall biosynthesis
VAGEPSITLLIRTFNSGNTLAEVLSRLDLNQAAELVVVDSGSTDSTLEIAARFQARILKLPPPFNYSRSLNEGFSAARGSHVLVLSSHCIPMRDDLVVRMKEAAAESADDIAVIYGSVSLFKTERIAAQILTGDETEWRGGGGLRGGNGFAMYPKKLWEARKFDESLRTAEDLEWLKWALATGCRASVVVDAVALYRNQGGLRYMYRKGWHETRHAIALQRPGTPGATVYEATRSLAMNFLYLSRLFFRRRLGAMDYMRLLAHGLGSARASVTPSPMSTERL